MDRSFARSSLIASVMVLAGLATSGCSKDDSTMLYVDVSLAGATAPATVELRVTQAQAPLATHTYYWPVGASMLKAGVGLPEGTSGTVTVSATGYSSAGAVVAVGTAEGLVGPDALTVVLQPVAPGGDAGIDVLAPTVDAGLIDLAIDLSPGVDGASHDLVKVEGASGETRPTSDGPLGDVLRDVAPGPDGPRPDRPEPGDVTTDIPIQPGDGGDTSPDGAGPQRTWSTPIQMDSESSAVFGVAMDPVTSNAVVVWADSLLGVMARQYRATANSWSSAVTLSSDPDINAAKVAVDAKGHYLAVWSLRGGGADATKPGLWGSFSSDGATWSTPTQLFAGGANNYDVAASLRIAMNRNGQAMVVWDHYQSPAYSDSLHKLQALYVDGTANQPAVMLASQRYEYEADVAIDDAGNGIIAWNDEENAVNAIMAATFVKQTVATPKLLRSDTDGDVEAPVVAMNGAGQGIVVWAKSISASSGYFDELYSHRYSPTESWAADAEQVTRTNSAATVKSIVLDSYGTASVVWSRSSGPGWQSTISTQAVGGAWGTQGLETDNLATSRYVQVTEPDPVAALDRNGNLLVGWRKKISDNEYVPNLRWRTDNTWGPVAQIGLVPDLFSSNLAVAASDDGRAVAAWSYYHCDPSWQYAEYVCPTAKTRAQMSAESMAAWGPVYVSVYR